MEGATAPGETRVEGAGPAAATGPMHEAFLAPGAVSGRVRVAKEPPAPLSEQPTEDRPDPRAQWVPGYWAWDAARSDFVWISGAWRVPPPGSLWVGGRWSRDAEGWAWTPGAWSRRQGDRATVPARVVAATPSETGADWRTTGPPADHPDDVAGAAPGRDFFYVPGHYRPDGDRVTWTPGFWARMQSGWDWIPARWVRRPGGWDFRPGSWTRDSGAADPGRYTVARPADTSSLPPAIESEPERAADRTDSRPLATPRTDTRPLAPTRSDTGRDPIAEAEDTTRAPGPLATVPGAYPPVVVVPPTGAYPWGRPTVVYPYYGPPLRVIRPPGTFPYGPAGVMVPAVTPPFVQRLLNRVLP